MAVVCLKICTVLLQKKWLAVRNTRCRWTNGLAGSSLRLVWPVYHVIRQHKLVRFAVKTQVPCPHQKHAHQLIASFHVNCSVAFFLIISLQLLQHRSFGIKWQKLFFKKSLTLPQSLKINHWPHHRQIQKFVVRGIIPPVPLVPSLPSIPCPFLTWNSPIKSS